MIDITKGSILLQSHAVKLIFEQEKPDDLIAFYVFVVSSEKCKEGCNYETAAKALKWKISKVKKISKLLLDLNLIIKTGD